MEGLIVIVVLVFLFCIAGEFSAIAEMKGFPESKYFWISFLFPICGYLLVIALPDRSQKKVTEEKMEERYTRLFTLPENIYSYGSPVVVSTGALLKDNTQGNVLVQLKIRNIQRKCIKALTVRINSFDTAGRKLGGETNFQYLDLNVKRDEEFGQKNLIILPDANARSFSVCVVEVVFDDQSISTIGNSQWEPMAKRIPLEKTIPNHQLVSQFRIKYGNQCIDSYQVYQDLWYCSCGAVNREEEPYCRLCGLQAAALATVDLNKLEAEKNERFAEEDKLRAEKETREKKRGKEIDTE